MTKRKLWILLLLGVAVIAILALSSSLARLEFSPGEPFALGSGIAYQPPPGAVAFEMSPTMRQILRVVLLLCLALVPFSNIYLIISPDARRKVLPNLIIFGILLLLIYLIRQQAHPTDQTSVLSGMNLAPPAEMADGPKPAEFSGAVPDWLAVVASFALATVVALLSVGLLWAFLRRRRQRAEPPIALEELAQQAEEAAVAIQAGGDLRDTVIRCYREMSRVVRDSRGILRQQAMTPREFEDQLERAGLPRDPVRDLTRLFEEVRYGSKALGDWEGRRAIACLTTIADACRGLA